MGEDQSLQHQLSDCLYTANVNKSSGTRREIEKYLSIDLLDIRDKEEIKITLNLGVWLIRHYLLTP